MTQALRDAEIPVVARSRDNAICFDLRTVRDADFEALVDAVTTAVWEAENDGTPPGDVPLRIL